MDAAAKRNNAAKAAIESALFDAVGRTLGVPAVQLLGGVVRERMPVFWTLASGDPAQEIEEAEAKLAARLHDRFKIKIGAQPLADDLARLRRIAAALEGRATLIVDANQAWDEATAVRAMPALADMGVTLVEQPLPAWNIAGLARVRARSAVPVMADECVFTPHDMMAVAEAAAADTLSLKLVKHGGLLGLRKVAAVAEAAGVSLYGGCLLESSIGAAAHLHAFAGLRTLAWGCEHFGPHILTEDLAVEPVPHRGLPHPPAHRPRPRRRARPRQAAPVRPRLRRTPMLYHVRMDVRPPHDIDPARFEALKAEEKARSQELQRAGKWPHLWRDRRAVLERLDLRRRRPRRAARDPVGAAALSLHADRSDPARQAPLGDRLTTHRGCTAAI